MLKKEIEGSKVTLQDKEKIIKEKDSQLRKLAEYEASLETLRSKQKKKEQKEQAVQDNQKKQTEVDQLALLSIENRKLEAKLKWANTQLHNALVYHAVTFMTLTHI